MRFRVKELAQQRGLTQEELALKSGVKLATLQRLWQNKGTSDARPITLTALAAALDVEPKSLYVQDGDDATISEGNKTEVIVHA